MTQARHRLPSRFSLLKIVSCLALLGSASHVLAGELYKLRQPPFGAFGGEIAAKGDASGFFGTAVLTSIDIPDIVDGDGNKVTLPGRTVPLPTGTPTGGLIPNGTYRSTFAPAAVEFDQQMTQLNLVGGYLTHSEYNGGRFAFAVNLPLVKIQRTFVATQPLGVVSPTPPAAMPAALRGAVNAVATAVNNQVLAATAAGSIAQNQEVSGMGDVELSSVWIRHYDRLRVAAGVSVYAPTGEYDKDRGPNPGHGNFYTVRPGVALSYALNPNHQGTTWDSGVTLGARVSFGVNTRNKDTDYRSGNFLYLELAAVKVVGNWAFGSNVLAITQVTDDKAPAVPADGTRYRNHSVGPFMSYKLPGKDAGFNLAYHYNFASENALVARALQLRFIKAW